MNLKKIFLVLILATLSVTALIGIYVVVVGRFGETEVKLLLTTFDIGFFSLMALCASIWLERKQFLVLSVSGLAVSAFALVMGLVNIWREFSFNQGPDETLIKMFITGAIVSIALAYVALIFLLRGGRPAVNNVIYFASGCVTVVALMLVGLIIFEWRVDDAFFRALAVFAILAVTGTIAAPILSKVTGNTSRSA